MTYSKIAIILTTTFIILSYQNIVLKPYQNKNANFEISIPETWDVKVTDKEVITKRGGWEDFYKELTLDAIYNADWAPFRPTTDEELVYGSENSDSSLKYQKNLKIIKTDLYTLYVYDIAGPGPNKSTMTVRTYSFNIKGKPDDELRLVAVSYKNFDAEEERLMKEIIASIKFL